MPRPTPSPASDPVPPRPAPASAVPVATAPAPDLPESPAAELRVALLRVTRRLKQQHGEADLPDGQHTVLVALYKSGPLTPGALAERERISAPSMTRTVNAIAELGLVRKVADPDDGRQVLVELTEAGRREIVETRRRRDAWLARQLDLLPAADRRTLHRAAEILLEVAAR